MRGLFVLEIYGTVKVLVRWFDAIIQQLRSEPYRVMDHGTSSFLQKV